MISQCIGCCTSESECYLANFPALGLWICRQPLTASGFWTGKRQVHDRTESGFSHFMLRHVNQSARRARLRQRRSLRNSLHDVQGSGGTEDVGQFKLERKNFSSDSAGTTYFEGNRTFKTPQKQALTQHVLQRQVWLAAPARDAMPAAFVCQKLSSSLIAKTKLSVSAPLAPLDV